MKIESRCTAARLSETGFTAIEIMIVAAIVAILATLAIPSFRDLLARHRVQVAADELAGGILFARAEAIKRGGGISLRKSMAGDCRTKDADDWSCGWIVFVDSDDDGMRDGAEEVLQASSALKGVALKFNNGNSFTKIDGWGQYSGLGALGFELMPEGNRNDDLRHLICMGSGGRLRLLSGAEASKCG